MEVRKRDDNPSINFHLISFSDMASVKITLFERFVMNFGDTNLGQLQMVGIKAFKAFIIASPHNVIAVKKVLQTQPNL